MNHFGETEESKYNEKENKDDEISCFTKYEEVKYLPRLRVVANLVSS